ncbi:hypothetical protein AAER74_26460, partial [Klebsiella pneumoniae]
AAVAFMGNYPQAAGEGGITGFFYGGGVRKAGAGGVPELTSPWLLYTSSFKKKKKKNKKKKK